MCLSIVQNRANVLGFKEEQEKLITEESNPHVSLNPNKIKRKGD